MTKGAESSWDGGAPFQRVEALERKQVKEVQVRAGSMVDFVTFLYADGSQQKSGEGDGVLHPVFGLEPGEGVRREINDYHIEVGAFSPTERFACAKRRSSTCARAHTSRARAHARTDARTRARNTRMHPRTDAQTAAPTRKHNLHAHTRRTHARTHAHTHARTQHCLA